ncbi:phenylalanine--tRNA ligase subunit beta [Candidatus Odyssella thessalonicensis]
MKFTLSWLKDHLDTSASLNEICDKLVNLGLEVENIENPAEKLKGFVVAHVVKREQHPNADRLSLCVIDDGSGQQLQVVCGAPNVRQGLKIAFAREGTVIPITGQALKKGVIRDVESQGMICSARELMIGENHDGIMELDSALVPGQDLATALKLDDPVIELSITPNRADCFGVRGIARDLAAAGLGTLKTLDYRPFVGTFDSPITVAIEASDICPEFKGVYIRNVKNGTAPDFIKHRLEAVGQNIINALVDITNYIAIDLGRPLHVFDAQKLPALLTVGEAQGGEAFEALNGKPYSLPAGAAKITANDEVISLGGIMGGSTTGATLETTDVLLECAHWDPIKTALAGQKLQLLSEARTRFERGVDPHSVDLGINAGVQLILQCCGGQPSHVVTATHKNVAPANYTLKAPITLTHAKLTSLGGLSISLEEAGDILSRLGFEVVTASTELTVTPPSFRFDIEGPADLVEEILRIAGYDNVPPVSLPQIKIQPKLPRKAEVVRQLLASRGLQECYTWSFLSEAKAQLFGGQAPHLSVENPISVELKVMRPSILPNLIDAAVRNHNRGLENCRFYEIAAQYSGKGEQLMASGLRTHHLHERDWQSSPRSVNVFDAKADALAVLAATGLSATSYQVEQGGPSYYHPGRCGTIRQGNRVLGYFGEVHPRILKALEADFPVVGFEVFLEMLPEIKLKKTMANFSNLQPVTRDFAFVIDQETPAEKLVTAIQKVDKILIKSVNIFDVYAGANIEAGKKSIAIEVRLEPTKATLTDAEIHELSDKIIAHVGKTVGGKIR